MAKIMIVDDDTELTEIVGQALKAAGHLVESLHDGRSALEMLATYPYELLILDWNLPDIDGPEIADRFRASGGRTPIIMLTARAAIKEKEKGFDAGADDYLTKPFQLAELLMRVKALLRRPQPLLSDTLVFEDISVDTSARRVSVAGADVQLSPKEFAILELLLKFPNEVFSQDAIVDRLWPSDTDVIAASVYSAIKSLRKKLKRDIIDTVYGAGYRLRKSN